MIGIVGPFFTGDPGETHRTEDGIPRIWEPPSSEFLLGTDKAGRDVFSQLCVGIGNSLYVGVIAGVLATLLGVLMGGFFAYKRGLIDETANLVANIFLVVPQLVVLIVIASILGGRSMFTLAVLIALFNWAWMARSIRSQVLSLRERKFVDLARISGERDFSIVVKEIMPNMLAYVFLCLIIGISSAVTVEAGLSMIGLGPTTAFTVGKMLYWAVSWETIRTGMWWYFIPPGALLVTFTGSLLMITAVIDDVLNPKVRTE
jgi:peptide/nickel transport system permease protein